MSRWPTGARRRFGGVLVAGIAALLAAASGAAVGGTAYGHSDIYTIDLATGHIAKVTHALPGAFYDSPTWSPDGTRIAFAGSPCDDCPNLDTRLYIASLTPRRIRIVKVSISPADRPSWDPHGKTLLFIGGPDASVYRVGTDGAGLQALLRGPAHDAAVWSPDGRQIAYTRQQANGNWDLYAASIDALRERPLTHTAVSEEQPAWSPDGKWIAFSRESTHGVWSLGLIGADGGRVLAVGPRWRVSAEDPAWSPDGRRLAFVAVSARSSSLFLMNRDGTGLRRIATHMSRSFGPAWSPDGRTLAFVGAP